MVQNNGSIMARSQRKTTIAVLRGILGPIHGQERRFAKLAKRSPSWVKKVSAGVIPINEETARRLELETGVALNWIIGPPGAPPVNGRGKPYTKAYFEWHRAYAKAEAPLIRSGGYPFSYAPKIAAIGCAAGDQGKASLFTWRLETFLDECAQEFGFDNKAHTLALSILYDAAKKAPYLARLVFVDKGFDVADLSDPRVARAIKKAVKGKPSGEPIEVKVTLPRKRS
jgi:hypothetical protein